MRKGDAAMRAAKKGDTVTIEYTGKLKDGTVFDSTIEGMMDSCADECDADEVASGDCGCGCAPGPMELTIGAGQLFPQIDEALEGMTPGQKKTVTIPAAEGFGEFDEEKVFTVPRSNLPDDFNPEVGDELVLTNEDDEEMGVAVMEVSSEGFRFNANHPLAGEDLTYEVHLIDFVS